MRDVHDGRTLECPSVAGIVALNMNPIYPRHLDVNLSGIKQQAECLAIHKELTKEKTIDKMIRSVCT